MVKSRNNDIKITELVISLKTDKYILYESRKEQIRIARSKKISA
jgi:hypothetical protein